ncbi:prepilin-type N-terminal cleavage/methylation domain-containing protein [Neobacillus sp. YIM B06451]|uniref:PilW family protein n=1 Tax=Neobacillus sp. YIM B06451 TaxID=3070994 RepID=UPI00292E6981|nr:prepilin-type N-terminal cleavage/methylation domain-containing protein [Neobacillus sp. YIM B06451]
MRNEKGITLIELLAGISILLVISSVIFGVLLNSNKNYKNISDKTNLNQEANIILATLKSYHTKQELHSIDSNETETYIIKNDPSSRKAYIGKSPTSLTPLQSEGILIDLKLADLEFTGEKTISPKDPLFVYFKISNKQGQYLEINTIIKQY